MNSLLQDSDLKLKKVGKTRRLFRYDLNQIPYDYTVKVTNRFKGLDPIECLKNYGWRFMTLYRKETVIKTTPKKKKGKMVFWGGLTNSQKKTRTKGKEKRKDIYIHLNAEFQTTARRDKKAFLSDQCKEMEENNRMGKTRDLFKKIQIPKKHFM